MQVIFVSLVILVAAAINGNAQIAKIDLQPLQGGPTQAPLGCHRRVYKYRVSQVDINGHRCWDDVSVMSCWGRCDSSEISDWRFPYKRSFHPVCVHASRQRAVALLRNCDAGASEEASRYEYMEAVTCHCQTCSSLDTSCEAPANNLGEENTGIKVMAVNDDNADALMDYD